MMRYNPFEEYRPIVKPVKDILDKEYRKQHTVPQLAKRTQVDIGTLRIAFRKGSLYSIRSYLHKVRIKKSVELLEETDMSVRSIAQEVGYTSTSTFARQFKEYAEITPTAWRKEHRAKKNKRRRKTA
jgi:AraC-like DNA-binding protein